MSRNNHGRGRPKGSGLDDSAKLAEIARLMARDPALKPTTAIKMIGVTDPSTVRRLRDKLSAGSPSLSPAGEPALHPALRAAPVVPPERATPSPASGLAAASPMTEAMAAETPAPSRQWFAIWGEIGFQAMASTFNLQMAIAGQAFRLPPLMAAMRQHIMFNEFTLAFCAPATNAGRTLH